MVGILRTNYRPAQLEIDAIGGGIPLASAWGGAGQYLPYGGLMYFSFSGTIMDQSTGVAANQSYAMVISTFGAMSQFYGSGIFSGGYKFLPVGARLLSLDAIAFSHGARPGFLPVIGTLMNSGSIALVKIYGYSISAGTGAAFLGTIATIAELQAKIWVWGFIVSAP